MHGCLELGEIWSGKNPVEEENDECHFQHRIIDANINWAYPFRDIDEPIEDQRDWLNCPILLN